MAHARRVDCLTAVSVPSCVVKKGLLQRTGLPAISEKESAFRQSGLISSLKKVICPRLRPYCRQSAYRSPGLNPSFTFAVAFTASVSRNRVKVPFTGGPQVPGRFGRISGHGTAS